LSDDDFYDSLAHYLTPRREKLAKELSVAVVDILERRKPD
jgi:hypothetical protein